MLTNTRFPDVLRKVTARHLAFLLLAGAAAAPALAEVPPRTYSGQTLEVPDADFERGQIFYVLPGGDTQLALTSTAPLRRTVLTTSRAVGYVVATFDPEESDQPILGAALRASVAALSSGAPAADAQLRGADFLDVDAHPEMTFELTGIGEVEKVPSDDEDVFQYRVKLRGKLTVRGVTREVEMTSQVRFLLTTFDTFARSVGDLLTVQGSFEVQPSDFGWEMPGGAARLVAPSLEVDVFLLGSTTSPDKVLDPDADVERWLAQQRYLTLARDLGDSEAAASHGSNYLTKYNDNAVALVSLARVILDVPGLDQRDLALARQLAVRARELDAESAQVTETLSRLGAARGDPSP